MTLMQVKMVIVHKLLTQITTRTQEVEVVLALDLNKEVVDKEEVAVAAVVAREGAEVAVVAEVVIALGIHTTKEIWRTRNTLFEISSSKIFKTNMHIIKPF